MEEKALALIDMLAKAFAERERENYREPFKTPDFSNRYMPPGANPLTFDNRPWQRPEDRTPQFIDFLSDYVGGYTDVQPFAPSGSPRREIKPK